MRMGVRWSGRDEENEEEKEAECAMGWWGVWPWHGGGGCS